jgi:hypothetical protein
MLLSLVTNAQPAVDTREICSGVSRKVVGTRSTPLSLDLISLASSDRVCTHDKSKTRGYSFPPSKAQPHVSTAHYRLSSAVFTPLVDALHYLEAVRVVDREGRQQVH